MRIHFWGVRGSIPSPLLPSQIQNRITAVVQRITAKDIESADARQRFLDTLPEWLYGTVGGNTSCVEIETDSGEMIILDAGSGLRELGLDILSKSRNRNSNADGTTFHILFSHYHWDHLQGLPFFVPAFNPKNKIVFYSTNPDLKSILFKQMEAPYFPVPMSGFGAHIEFVHLHDESRQICIGDSVINWKEVNHPGGCTSFSVASGGKKMIYATDTELSPEDFIKNDSNRSFFGDTDMLVIDAQYTMGDALEKTGWGHSYFSLSVDFAATWGIKKLFLFHHEPTYSDKKIYSLRQSAQWYLDYVGTAVPEIIVAREGEDFIL